LPIFSQNAEKSLTAGDLVELEEIGDRQISIR
jgi:hypothetical protein